MDEFDLNLRSKYINFWVKYWFDKDKSRKVIDYI